MARNPIMAALMAVILAVVIFTVITALSEKPDAATPQAQAATELELDVSQVRTLVDQAVAEKAAELTPAPRPEPDKAPPPPHIRRVELDGQDIADLLNLNMYKFAFHLPEGEYTNYVWLERWTRDAEQPQVEVLAQTPGVWDDGQLVIKLPNDSQQGLFVRINELMTRNASMQSLDIPTPVRVEALKRREIDPAAASDIHLVTFTHNDSGTSIGGRVDVHRDHDVTIYIKTRFAPGPFVPFELKRGQGAATDETDNGETDSE